VRAAVAAWRTGRGEGDGGLGEITISGTQNPSAVDLRDFMSGNERLVEEVRAGAAAKALAAARKLRRFIR